LQDAVDELRRHVNDLQEQIRTQQTSAVNMTALSINSISHAMANELNFALGCTSPMEIDDNHSFGFSSIQERNTNDQRVDEHPRGRVNDSPRLAQCGHQNTSPESPYYRNDFRTPQRSNACNITLDGCNAGLDNNNVICYANAIFQKIATCGHVDEALCNPPSIEHQHFSLYCNFASVISSMISGKLDVANPQDFMEVFRDCHQQFNADEGTYCVVNQFIIS
jgi:hypothetical protein